MSPENPEETFTLTPASLQPFLSLAAAYSKDIKTPAFTTRYSKVKWSTRGTKYYKHLKQTEKNAGILYGIDSSMHADICITKMINILA